MSIIVAEYLGIRTTTPTKIIPIIVNKDKQNPQKPILPCPFKNSHCDKAKRGDKPICSVRETKTNELWIVCSHRLCATSPKHSDFTDHQKSILHQIAMVVFDKNITIDDVLVKREASVTVTDESNYSADYVMWRKTPVQNSPFNPERAFILEMQGGGETTDTGHISKHVEQWELSSNPNNAFLCKEVKKASPLVTNAWRRQQEQFLVKGNVAMLTGGRMVFCVGSKIYDYLLKRFRKGILTDLKDANWTLAIITFIEDETLSHAPTCAPNSIPLKIDHSKTIFTNYNSFVQVLTNQAEASPNLFVGEYMDLNNQKITI